MELRTRPTAGRRFFKASPSWAHDLGFPTGTPATKKINLSHTGTRFRTGYVPWDSSSWIWGDLIETWCQPFAINGNISLHLTPQVNLEYLFIFKANLECKKELDAEKEVQSVGLESVHGAFSSLLGYFWEVFLFPFTPTAHWCVPLAVEVLLYFHISCRQGKSCLEDVKCKLYSKSSQQSEKQNSCSGYNLEISVTFSEPCCHHPNHPGYNLSTIREITFPIL